jgi:hypothetical protein
MKSSTRSWHHLRAAFQLDPLTHELAKRPTFAVQRCSRNAALCGPFIAAVEGGKSAGKVFAFCLPLQHNSLKKQARY